MKFWATTAQEPQDANETGVRPERPARPLPFKMPTMPNLKEKRSKTDLFTTAHIADVENVSTKRRPVAGFLKRKKSAPILQNSINDVQDMDGPAPAVLVPAPLKTKKSMPNLKVGAEDVKDTTQSPAMKQALRDLLMRTGSNIRATGSRFEHKMPQSRPIWAKQSSQRRSLSFDSGEDVLERIVRASKESKRTLDSHEMTYDEKDLPFLTDVDLIPAPLSFIPSSPTVPPKQKPASNGYSIPRKPIPKSPVLSRKERSREDNDTLGLDAAASSSSNNRPAPMLPSRPPPLRPTESREDVSKKPFTTDELRAMRSGAPIFRVDERKGRYRPRIICEHHRPETPELLVDYRSFGHPSFDACTSRVYLSGDFATETHRNGRNSTRANRHHKLVEIPSMLSAGGLDPGAVGFEHFLQLPIADDVVRAEDADLSIKRKLLKTNPAELGLRPPNIEVMIYRLGELGKLHSQFRRNADQPVTRWTKHDIDEMGMDLFGKLLSPDLGTTSTGSFSVSLKTQILALQKILKTNGLWYDFQLVEWRTKLGKLLWEPQTLHPDPVDKDDVLERDILFLQITLAAELLLRINAVKAMNEPTPILPEREMDVLDSLRTTKTEWDLLLAERFMENVSVSTKMTAVSQDANNRTSLYYSMPFLWSKESDDDVQSLQPRLVPNYGEQQLDGLRYFAETLQWPHVRELPKSLQPSLDMGDKYVCMNDIPGTYLTPPNSPPAVKTPTSASGPFELALNFETSAYENVGVENVDLVPVHSSEQFGYAGFEACGWMSRSWLSGLIMPGEAASHFLISTLLEHSPQATARLGRKANLYGGFLYAGRSYWSKSCVVGRILAAKQSAVECMEWISVPELGEAKDDRWIDLDVEAMPDSSSRPRIMNPEAVAKDSELMPGNEQTRVGDFVWPTDGPLLLGSDIKCQSLSFESDKAQASDPTMPTLLATKSLATLTFSSFTEGKRTTIEIPLQYDACFISSHPCRPVTVRKSTSTATSRPQSTPLSLPTSPTSSYYSTPSPRSSKAISPRQQKQSQEIDSGYASKQTSASTISLHSATSTQTKARKQSSSEPIHPLPKQYAYDVVSLQTLFFAAVVTRPRMPSSARPLSQNATQRPNHSKAPVKVPEVEKLKEVTIIDCRGMEDGELFARAWCAQVGENAIIGRSERTCLACCIREARALGLCVVIRI